MLWTECCGVSACEDREKVKVGGRRPSGSGGKGGPDSPKSPHPGSTRSNERSRWPHDKRDDAADSRVFPNVGIAAVAAGEVRLQDLQDPPSAPGSEFMSRFDPRYDAGGNQVDSQPIVEGDEIMPFRRERTRMPSKGSATIIKRGSITHMEGYLQERRPSLGDGGEVPSASSSARPPAESPGISKAKSGESPRSPLSPSGKPKRGGEKPEAAEAAEATKAPEKTPLTKENFRLQALVVRGPDWKWGGEDGGDGKVGILLEFNEATACAKVIWQGSGLIQSHYRCGRCRDLALCSGPEAENTGYNGLQRMSTAKDLFAESSQTFICFDWDDTLFPTTYVRDDLDLDWRTPMKNQRLPHKEKEIIIRNLEKCEINACQLIAAAAKLGKVVLVTLARSPWVRDSCAHFFPKVGEMITRMKLPVIYAQDGAAVEYDKSQMSSNADIEKFWSMVKGRAITAELKNFYNQYEGQSWKNVISIGDSDFERLGTMAATRGYMEEAGLIDNKKGDGGMNALQRQRTMVVKGKVYKVRTKTFKMLDQPTVEELTVELAMLQKWLPLLIKLDNSCDVNLNDVEDPTTLQRIERTLRGIVLDSP
mmetsp:Transcript_30507/g.80923  ORF Transcript_30507/g.80923 Transcript_30507/m.80923 type:complete len:592 (+) Transcript_30507:100-1875(+)